MTFWELLPGTQGSVVTSSTAIAGTQLFTNSPNQQAWISSSRLVPVNPHHTYEVLGSFRRPTTTGSAGGIYLAVRLFDEAKANITGDGTWWYYPVANASLTDTDWHTFRARFGDGTARAIPANARYMSVGAVLNYDGTVAGNRNYETAGLTIRAVSRVASETNDHGALAVQAGSAHALYTPYRVFQQGTYLVNPYNCLAGTSTNYYVQWTAEANSGTIVSGEVNRNFSEMGSFHLSPFVMKVRSPTANVRFKVYNPSTGSSTVSNGSNSCTHFSWTQIGL